LEADDVHHRMSGWHERGLGADLAQRTHDICGPLSRSPLPLEDEDAHALVDCRQVAVEDLLGLVGLGREVSPFAELQNGLLRRRPVGARADHRDALPVTCFERIS
jgi:hypothetical protein